MLRVTYAAACTLALCCFASSFAQDAEPATEFKTTLPKMELEDGDALVFLGDSITHQCLYTQYVEDYFYTHYPRRRIHFHNAGVGGDRAQDALLRFDDDVAEFKPKYVTILLGMNDGSYTNFKQEVFDTYEADMTEILDRLAAAGAQAIPMTPTMFDSRAALMRGAPRAEQALRNNYYNGVLAFYGAWLREQAFRRGLGFVDMYAPLNDLTVEGRNADHRFTLIRDAVHPDAPGQVVMALALLEDMHADPQVSAIQAFKPASGQSTWKLTARGGLISQLESAEGLKFTFTAEALPWVVPEEAAAGFELCRAGQKMSRERIRIAGLDPGRYALKIDGQIVGAYGYQRLADGIGLHNNSKTPQHQQALQVAMLNKQRNDEAMRPLRGWWGQRKGRRYAIARADSDEKRSQLQQEMDEWLPEFHTKVRTLLELARQFEDKIYEANQPQPHEYEITPL